MVILTQRGSRRCLHLEEGKKGSSSASCPDRRLMEPEAEGKKTATSNSAEDEAGLLLEALHNLEDIDDVLSSPVFECLAFRKLCPLLRSTKTRVLVV